MSAEAENPFQIDVSAAHDGNRDQEFEDRYGGDVPVVFHLPDGTTNERVFKMGNQVEQLKGYLEQVLEIPYGSQSHFLGSSDGEFMIDPLSLSDFKAIVPNRQTHIYVKTQ